MTDVDTSDFEDCDWDAVNEMVSSGWSREDAIREVRNTLDIDKGSQNE